MELRAECKVWLVDDDGEYVFGEGLMSLVSAVEEEGTLKSASESTGMSYRYALSRIEEVEERLGTDIVETRRGGEDRGGTRLTETGLALAEGYEEKKERAQEAIDEPVTV